MKGSDQILNSQRHPITRLIASVLQYLSSWSYWWLSAKVILEVILGDSQRVSCPLPVAHQYIKSGSSDTLGRLPQANSLAIHHYKPAWLQSQNTRKCYYLCLKDSKTCHPTDIFAQFSKGSSMKLAALTNNGTNMSLHMKRHAKNEVQRHVFIKFIENRIRLFWCLSSSSSSKYN